MINSLLKAIDLLELFSPAEPRLTLTQMSQRLGMPKSTVHNLLTTLLSRGYVEKVDFDHYALGTAVIALTQGVRVNVELRDRAAPLLRELADETHNTVYLGILDEGLCLYIYAIESPRRLLARTAVGERVPPHCTGIGKAQLAHLPSAEVDAIIERYGLPGFTEATITERGALFGELQQIRAQGYAVDAGEHEYGTFCVAAPILNERSRVIGGCSLSGLDEQMLREHQPALAARVMLAAQEISRRMGYVPPSSSRLHPAQLRALPQRGL